MAGRVLIVDSEARTRAALATEVRCLGYAVSLASNPTEALELLREQGADILVADPELATRRLELPVGDLIELAPEICPSIRCVLVGDATPLDTTTREGLVERGVVDVLGESAGPGDLERALRLAAQPAPAVTATGRAAAPLTLTPSNFADLPVGDRQLPTDGALVIATSSSRRPVTSTLVSAAAVLGANGHGDPSLLAATPSRPRAGWSKPLLWGSAVFAALLGAALALVLLSEEEEELPVASPTPLTSGARSSPAPSSSAPSRSASPVVEPLRPTEKPSPALPAIVKTRPETKRRQVKAVKRTAKRTAKKAKVVKAPRRKDKAPVKARPKKKQPAVEPALPAKQPLRKRPAIGILD